MAMFGGAAIAAALALSGCGDSGGGKAPGKTDKASTGPIDPALAKVMLSAAPPSAKDCKDVRLATNDGDEVVVEGYIRDYTERAAPFELVEKSFVPCYKKPGEDCPTPWDFCCDDYKPTMIVVEPIGPDGKVIKGVLFGDGGLKRNDLIVAKGKVKKDAKGNVTLFAAGIFNKGGGLAEK
jgi:hypothetical protein